MPRETNPKRLPRRRMLRSNDTQRLPWGGHVAADEKTAAERPLFHLFDTSAPTAAAGRNRFLMNQGKQSSNRRKAGAQPTDPRR